MARAKGMSMVSSAAVRTFWSRACAVAGSPSMSGSMSDSRCSLMLSMVTPLFVAIVNVKQAPLMLLPLCIESRRRCRVLTFLNGNLSDYDAPVVFGATRDWKAQHARLVWRELKKILPPFDIAVFERMPRRVGELQNPFAFLGSVAHPDPPAPHT